MFQQRRIRRAALAKALAQASFTRSELAGSLDVRMATVVGTLRGLIREGVLEEPVRRTGQSTGRKASPLRIRPGHSRYLGFALSPGTLQAVLLDAGGSLLAQQQATWERPLAPAAVLAAAVELAARLRRKAGKSAATIRGAGFADPGLVDESGGIALKAVNLPGWEKVAVARELGPLLGCPVLVRPEMSARALAEIVTEKAGQEGGCLHLNVGDGVGAAFSRAGEIFTGDNACQMEIGHLVVEEDGLLCTCGNRGCLEAYAGRRGLARRVQQIKAEGVSSSLAAAPFDLDNFIEAVRSRDKAAVRIALDTAAKIGQALASACSLLNPGTISLSGPLFTLHDLVLPVLRQSVVMRCLPETSSKLVWRCSGLGSNAPALGAALSARRQMLLEVASQPSAGERRPPRQAGR